jgi:hypothetical protein
MFTYPKPVKPLHLVRQDDLMNRINGAMAAALRGHGAQFYSELAQELALDLRKVQESVTEEDRAAEHRYRLEVRKYNEAVDAHNAGVKARRQTRVNARQVAQVRQSACPRCFATHAGEC